MEQSAELCAAIVQLRFLTSSMPPLEGVSGGVTCMVEPWTVLKLTPPGSEVLDVMAARLLGCITA